MNEYGVTLKRWPVNRFMYVHIVQHEMVNLGYDHSVGPHGVTRVG